MSGEVTLERGRVCPQQLGRFSLVESVLYGDQPLYDWPASPRTEFQFSVIRDAFVFHYERCTPYRRFANGAGVRPESLRAYDDLRRIPLIPSSLFKELDIRSVPPQDVAKVCLSSGTRGILSRVPRDTVTLERFL